MKNSKERGKSAQKRANLNKGMFTELKRRKKVTWAKKAANNGGGLTAEEIRGMV